MKSFKIASALSLSIFISACASKPGAPSTQYSRVILDNSARGRELAPWVQLGRVSWVDGSDLKLKSEHTIRGDQRINACYDLAKIDAKQNVLSEIRETVRAEVNAASQGIDEADAQALNKMFSQTIEGQLTGLRMSEVAYERYLIRDVERVDCYVLFEIKKADYERLRQTLAANVRAISPDVQKALEKRQSKFFAVEEPKVASEQVRASASTSTQVVEVSAAKSESVGE